MNFEKLERTPQSFLMDNTAIPDNLRQSGEAPKTGEQPKPANTSLPGQVDESTVIQAGKHTDIPLLSRSDAPNPANSANPANPANNMQPPPNSVSLGAMFEGKYAIELIDTMIPALFVAAFYALDVKLRKSELQLTQKEKDTLTPLMQNYLNSVMLNFNSPLQALLVGFGIIYGSKITERGLVAYIDKQNEKKEREALDEKFRKSNEGTAVNNTYKSPNEIQNPTQGRTPPPYTQKDIEDVKKARKRGLKDAIDFLNKKHNYNP